MPGKRKHDPSCESKGVRFHLLVLGVAAVLTIFAYSGSLRGEFVYDDDIEIVENPYIQHSQYFWRAMRSDVWAFKGQREQAWSNYWRPMFVAWMALNYRLFGLETTGWHVLSLLAHVVVSVLVYCVPIRLRMRPAAAAVVCWLFAVHPVHVESVAWASGIPDILMSGFVLASYLCFLRAREEGSASIRWTIFAVLLYALCLLSKEGAIVFPAIIFLTDWLLNPPDHPNERRAVFGRSVKRTLPFVAVGVAFLIVRFLVLGAMRTLAPFAPGLGEVFATAPVVLAFYVRQILLPVELGPMYGVRVISGESIATLGVIISYAVALICFCGAAYTIVKGRRWTRLGLLWFLLPIGLAFDIRVFLPEHLVHDRYLYLPLLGALIMVAGCITAIVERLVRHSDAKRSMATMSAGLILSVVLALVTRAYVPVWGDNIRLWERAVAVDPNSAYAHAELGEHYRRRDRPNEARDQFDAALAINSTVTNAHTGLGMIALAEKRFADAEARFQLVLSAFPDHALSIDQLALTYQMQGRFDDAIRVLEDGIKRLPYMRITYTVNIAVLNRNAGRRDVALAGLESIQTDLEGATNLREIRGWFFLGKLYAEMGRWSDAIEPLSKYIQATEGREKDAEVRQFRRMAQKAIRQIKQHLDQAKP